MRLLPITAGMEYVAADAKQGFKLKSVTQKGKPLDLQKKYKVTVLDKETYFRHKAEELLPDKGEAAFIRGKNLYVLIGCAILKPASPWRSPCLT